MKSEDTYADVMALYLSCPAVSQIWALTVLPSTWILRVANSTPMVLLPSRLNSLRVWSERAGYSCPHRSHRSEPLQMKRTRVREINQRMVLLNAIVFAIVPGDTHDTERLSRFHVCACRNRPPFTAITFEYFTHKGCVSTKLLTMNEKGTTEE